MARRRMVYEGKAKILYEGPEPDTLIQYFKDEATAFDAQKKAVIEGKGVLNNRLSEHFMTGLNAIGVPTHFIRRINMREQLIRMVEMIPLEVVVRNYAAGSISKRLGIPEGQQLPRPIIEFYYKDDALHDPLVSEEHVVAFNWASQQDIDDMIALALRVNDFLSGMFLGVGIRLVDFKIEVGRVYDGDFQRLIVADEISPDSLPALGHRDRAQARQGRVPPGPRLALGRLHRGRQAPRGDAAHQRPHPRRPEARQLMKARVHVTLKPGVLDPQGEAVRHALGALGFDGVGEVRIGKVIELELAGRDEGAARAEVGEMCEKLLANTVIEAYTVELA